MIPKTPYTAWNIDEGAYPENSAIGDRIKFLISYAVLAPSSHNTQPWIFEVDKNTLKVLIDTDRLLPFSDRTHRQTYISLGCAISNFIIAANHFGFCTKVTYLPENQPNEVVAEIKLSIEKNAENTKEDLFDYITVRRTNRFPHTKKRIDIKIIQEIQKLGIKNVSIKVISNKRIIGQLGNVIKKASKFAFSNKTFKLELSNWVRSVYTLKKDGIQLFDFGIPPLLTILGPYAIKRMPAIIQSHLDQKAVKGSIAILVLSARYDTKEYWLKTGIVFQKVALYCTKNNISIAPMAAMIEHNSSKDKLKSLIGTSRIPTFFARLGYSSDIPHHSSRRERNVVIV